MYFDDCLKIAKAQAAADYGIDIAAFDGGTHVFAAKAFDCHSRRTKSGKPFLDMVSFGNGVVTVADESIVPYVSDYLNRCGQNSFRAFDAPNIFELNSYAARRGFRVGEMAQGFLPSVLGKTRSEDCVALYGNDINRLYGYKNFSEALCYSCSAPRRDIIAVVYYDGGEPVAVAGCSNDSDDMYQIGVDVLPEYRRRGLGSLLVSRLTELIADIGKCPYYRCAWSNIASRRTALSCGYTEAWVELSFEKI